MEVVIPIPPTPCLRCGASKGDKESVVLRDHEELVEGMTIWCLRCGAEYVIVADGLKLVRPTLRIGNEEVKFTW